LAGKNVSEMTFCVGWSIEPLTQSVNALGQIRDMLGRHFSVRCFCVGFGGLFILVCKMA